VILYGSSFSPFVRKVLAFAAEKGIALESKNVGIGDADPGFRSASPFGKMPALVDEDYRLADSSAIIHYLEAKHPQPALIPSDPRQRGQVIWWEEFSDTLLMGCLAKMFFNRVVAPTFLRRTGDLEVAAKAEREEWPPVLDYLERSLPEAGYLVGEKLTLADLAVASPLANLNYMGVLVDAGSHPRTADFTARILGRPSFAPLLAREKATLERLAAA
jgi:glutathione S-transferase